MLVEKVLSLVLALLKRDSTDLRKQGKFRMICRRMRHGVYEEEEVTEFTIPLPQRTAELLEPVRSPASRP